MSTIKSELRLPEPEFYLWHLAQIGVIELGADRTTRCPLWTKQLPETRVAIIDSGCARRHPNLPAAAIEAALDLAIMPAGGVYQPEGEHQPRDLDLIGRARQDGRERLANVLADSDRKAAAELQRLADDLVARQPEILPTNDPADWFASHGTACAGLVAGRYLGQSKAKKAVLPYFGVNPYATIVPIATPYSHEIRPLIVALLHAVALDADVILLPRAVNDLLPTLAAERLAPDAPCDGTDLRATRFDTELSGDKYLFEVLLRAVAAWRPLVLAAGNDGRDSPAYPAALVNPAFAPPCEDLIVVGAANRDGLRSSYSSGTQSTGVTVYAPSDDEERVDAGGIWYNPLNHEAPWIRHSLGQDAAPPPLYSPFTVLGLEVPGRTLTETEVPYDPSTLPTWALYSQFGGTSAASAIVAGALSLAQAYRKDASKRPLSGADAKRLFRAAVTRRTHDQALPQALAARAVEVIDVPKLLEAALNVP